MAERRARQSMMEALSAVPFPRLRLFVSLAVSIVALLVYVSTIAPSMDFIDAGELATVAHTWGIAHPTGYPLFTLLAGLWALLPIGSGIFRLNLFSAVLSAAAAGIAVQFFYELLRLRPQRSPARGKGRKPKAGETAAAPAATSDEVGALLSAGAGGLLLAFGGTFWRSALTIEVYPLHMLMLSLLLWSAARLFFLPATDGSALRRRMMLTALLLGLSFSNHMSTVFLLPAFALLLLMTHARRPGIWKEFLWAGASLAAGLLPYLYLPLRAAANPYLNWGDPATLEKFIWHVTGKQYSVWMFSSSEAWASQFMHGMEVFGRDSGLLALLPVAVGLAAVFRLRRDVGLFLLTLFLTCVIWAAGYDIPDIDSYFLLGFFVFSAWAAFGIRQLSNGKFFRKQALLRNPMVWGLVLLIPLFAQTGRISQAGNYLVEDYTMNMYASLEENALVMSFQWDFWVSASYYYQQVEGMRPDVIVLDKELFRRSWYFEQLRHNYPDVYEASREEIEAFLPHLERFEQGLPYDPVAIEEAFNAVVNGIIERAYKTRPVYVTIEMEKQFAPGYVRVPQGLAFRIYRPEDLPDPADTPMPELRYRNFQSQERLPVEMRNFYASMLLNRAVYLFNAGLYSRVDPLLRQALTFAPDDRRLHEWMRRNEQRMRVDEAGRGDEGRNTQR
ncbi:MAG: DUF2723 domain-containing protein [Bacteroidetes bacterium]|nr:DUF2723 domain-containing protein [Bacteroidota bacterium]